MLSARPMVVRFVLLAIFGSPCPYVAGQEMKPLFNGKDLSGWVLVNTPPETWSVKDGMLVCTGKPIGELRTEIMFQNFELELEWRHMVPKGNAGIFVWADDITSRGVPFHRGIEVQVLENSYGNSQSHTTHGDIFPIHGATMTPVNGRGGSRAFPTEERSKPSPEWNHYRIVCNDGSISLAVNGKLVTQGNSASPRKGYICLESEGGVVHYRNIRIKSLPETPIEAKDIALANRNLRSIYTGLNLNGWRVHDSSNASWQAKDWVLAFDGSVAAEKSRIESRFDGLEMFVLDFQFNPKSESFSLYLPGDANPIKFRARDDDQFGKSLQKIGAWNRIEGSLLNGEWALMVNGSKYSIKRHSKSDSGTLAIESAGPLSLANLFVRTP